MKTMSIRVDKETEDALKFLVKQESAYLLRNVTKSEVIRSLILKETLRFAYTDLTKKQVNNSDN